MPKKATKRPRKRKKRAASRAAQGASGEVSPTAYAQHKGVTRQAIQRAIREGRLRESVRQVPHGNLMRWRIDLERADAEWARTTGPRKEVPIEDQALPTPPATGGDSYDVTLARGRKESAMADLQELRVAKEVGQLVSAEAASQEFFTITRAIRDAVLAVPTDEAAKLFTAQSVDELEFQLEAALVKALERASEIPECLKQAG